MRNFVLLIGIISAFLFILLTGFEKDSVTYPLSASVIEKSSGVGLSIDPDKIDFGLIDISSNITKVLRLSNDDERNVKVSISTEGNISKMLKYSDMTFLAGREKKDVRVSLSPSSTGNFTGKLTATFIKPRFDWISWLLPFV